MAYINNLNFWAVERQEPARRLGSSSSDVHIVVTKTLGTNIANGHCFIVLRDGGGEWGWHGTFLPSQSPQSLVRTQDGFWLQSWRQQCALGGVYGGGSVIRFRCQRVDKGRSVRRLIVLGIINFNAWLLEIKGILPTSHLTTAFWMLWPGDKMEATWRKEIYESVEQY